MIAWLYTFTWNEERLARFFLRHYRDATLWRHIVVYDNGSTDKTLAILKNDPRVEIRHYDSGGQHSDQTMKELRDRVWKEARGRCDWVYTPDFDEFLWHQRTLSGFLMRLKARGVCVAKPYGIEMVSQEYPEDDLVTPIVELVREGCPHPWYSKPTLFRPDMVEDMNFSRGAHVAYPVDWRGKPVDVHSFGSLLCLHYKRLGWDWWKNRTQTLAARFAHREAVNNESHYLDPEEAQRKEFEHLWRGRMDVTT